MLGMLTQLGIEQGKPFNPDARTQRILEQAARTALAEMRVALYAGHHTGTFGQTPLGGSGTQSPRESSCKWALRP